MKRADLDIPAPWRRSLARVLKQRPRRIVVVGASDRGKSTYCGFLVRGLASKGIQVALVDADPGQKDVGPPGSLGLAYGRPDRPLSALALSGLVFVGAVSPMGQFSRLVVGTRLLVEEAERRAEVTVVDTTGLVHGPGRALKELQFESLRPDLVVAIGREGELDSLLAPFHRLPILRLPASPRAVGRSANQRRQAREAAFRAYFRGGVERVIPLERLAFQRTVLFSGMPLMPAGAIWAERLPEGMLAVGGAGEGLRWHLPVGFESGVLCGLADGHQRCLGLAVIRAIDFAEKQLRLYTPVAPGRIRVVQPGELRVRGDGVHTVVPREEWFPR